MKEPKTIIPAGTRVVVTHLEDTMGYFVPEKHLLARHVGARGKITGYVPGHGGDVYAVSHEDGEATTGAYGWWEFELDESPGEQD